MKEDFEWIRSWTDYSNNNDLPRVLLIGDSITEGYNQIVREGLKGVCYVDHIATSYPVDRVMYRNLITTIANDSDYDLIHFNHGLHGFEMSIEDYKKYMEIVLSSFKCKNIVMVTSTRVNIVDKENEDPNWKKVVEERNDFVKEYALKHNLPIDDLNKLSHTIDYKDRLKDGFHYELTGYQVLGSQVIKIIKENLKK